MQVHTAKGSCTIREAMPSDLPQLVSVHVTSFNATYPDHNPKPGYDLRERQWKRLFMDRPNGWFCYVALASDGLMGFASGHAFSDPTLPYKGQLDKIHIFKSYQRMGLGSLLVFHVVNRFLQHDIASMILFADPANPSVLFYDDLQGKRLLDNEGQFNGAYGWHNLHALAALLYQRQQRFNTNDI